MPTGNQTIIYNYTNDYIPISREKILEEKFRFYDSIWEKDLTYA